MSFRPCSVRGCTDLAQGGRHECEGHRLAGMIDDRDREIGRCRARIAELEKEVEKLKSENAEKQVSIAALDSFHEEQLDDIEKLKAERDNLKKAKEYYEDGITWQTQCLNCAQLMNQIYDLDQVQNQKLRGQVSRLVALTKKRPKTESEHYYGHELYEFERWSSDIAELLADIERENKQ